MQLRLSDSVRMALSCRCETPDAAPSRRSARHGVSAFIAWWLRRGARGSVGSQFETLGSNLLRGVARPPRARWSPAAHGTRRRCAHASPHARIRRPYGHPQLRRQPRRAVMRAPPHRHHRAFTRVRDEPITAAARRRARRARARQGVCARHDRGQGLFPSGEPLGARSPSRVAPAGWWACSRRRGRLSGSDLDDRVVMPLSTSRPTWGSHGAAQSRCVLCRLPPLRRQARDQQHPAARAHVTETGGDNYSIASPTRSRGLQQIGGIRRPSRRHRRGVAGGGIGT